MFPIMLPVFQWLRENSVAALENTESGRKQGTEQTQHTKTNESRNQNYANNASITTEVTPG